MSIIAQARLTLVSQRCISQAAWRFDVRDGYGYFYSNQAHKVTERQPFVGSLDHIVARRVVKCENHRDSCLANLSKYETSCFHEINSPLRNLLVSEHRERSNRYSKRGAPLKEYKLTYCENNSRSIDPCRVKYLLNNMAHTPARSVSFRSSKHRHKRQGFYENHHQERKNSSYIRAKYVFPLLGAVGLFGGMTSGDIEEKKAKLTDEQKIKKMKPSELLIAKGVLSMCDQEYEEANDLFHKALRLAQDDVNEEQETLILNLLAANFFESGDFESAEKLFIELIKRLMTHNSDATDPAILELSLKLASIYSKNKSTHDKAMKGFKFVINSLLNSLHDLLHNMEDIEIVDLSDEKKNELALLGWTYDWFAKHLIAMNDYNGAADMLQRALQISSKVLGPLHDQTLILLNDVGTTLAMNEFPEEGKTFLKKAVEGAITSQSKELASFYVNLGLVNLKLKKLSEAKRYCEYSIELALKNREHHNSHDVIELSKSCLNEVERLLAVDN